MVGKNDCSLLKEHSKWVICRICLKMSDEDMVDIFLPHDDFGDLVEKIEMLSSTKLNVSHQLPRYMCSKCMMLLKVAIKFRQCVRDSEEQLNSIILVRPSKIDEKYSEELIEDTTVEKEDNQDDISSLASKEETSNFEFLQSEDNLERLAPDVTVETEEDKVLFSLNNDVYASCSNEDPMEFVDVKEMEEIELGSETELSEFKDYEIELLNDHHPDICEDSIKHFEILGDSDEDKSERSDVALYIEDNQDSVDFKSIKPFTKQPKININDKIKRSKVRQNVKKQSKSNADKIKMSLEKASLIKSQKTLDNVLDIVEENAPAHVCGYCGNAYYEKSKLTLHMKNHSKIKPHECEICHKRFTQTPQLTRHMNSHTGNRPYKCSYCSASFADPSTKIKHQRIHTNERPYSCGICGKTFTYSNVLKSHMAVHSGMKPYSCSICNKKFTQQHHMKTHESTHSQIIGCNR